MNDLTTTGDKLTELDKRCVLSAYVHRFTGQHKPQWSNGIWKDGKPFPVQFASDSDWLENTRFHVRNDGSLDERFNHIQSSPTWPFNPELRKS